jgi:TRAP-type C4-dicarboxylate transport system permease large subunit
MEPCVPAAYTFSYIVTVEQASTHKVRLKDQIRETIPLIGVLIVALAIITSVPQAVTLLTRLMR